MFEILKNHTDVCGNLWAVVFVFEDGCPDWAWEAADGHKAFIRCFGGYENALCFVE